MVYKEIVGQKKVKDILSSILQSKKIPHSFLFLGEEGSQHKKMAHLFAKSILCDNVKEEFCDLCTSCNLFSSHTHPDLFCLKPSGKLRQMKKDNITSLIKFLSLKSYRAGYKVVVIEDAERLKDIASNTLLKSLEEPPDNSIFILTCHKESNLLPTIVSRCQQIEFPPLDDSTILHWIQKQDNLDYSPQLLVKLSDGFLGRIKEENLNVLMKNREIVFTILEDWLKRGMIAIIDASETILSYIDTIRKKNEKEINNELKAHKEDSPKVKKKLEDELIASMEGLLKQKLDNIFEIFSDFFRDILLIKEKISLDSIKNIDKLDILKKARFKIQNIENKIILLDNMRKRFQTNVNQKLALEAFLLQLFSN